MVELPPPGWYSFDRPQGAQMSVEGKIIGVDLDGVCSDFYGRMREIAAEWFERPIDELPPEVSYGLKEWGSRRTSSTTACIALQYCSEVCLSRPQ
jgi:hypothetical protein